jgi:formate dehydrogenase iron-sulfur subunit
MIRIFVPCDATALGMGAERIVAAIRREADQAGAPIQIVRTGTRGMVWLEPLVEVETAQGRIGYGPVSPDDVASLFAAGFLDGGDHPLSIGKPEEHPWQVRQTRLTFARCGLVDPLSAEDYRVHGGYAGLDRALAMSGEAIVDEVKLSGLRGRGGAGFPTGIKWNTVRLAPAEQRYVVCNADEGDSGTFADRMLMEGDPFTLIEGMTIAGLAVEATRGFIYCRSEYPHAFRTLQRAIAAAMATGMLGADIGGSGRAFFLEARLGAGAYICGEETSLLESLEGRRGMVRAKPPLPAIQGLFGKPTIVNNVLSLAAVPFILANGGKAYAKYGTGRSLGTLAVQLAGNIRRGGLIEVAFGTSLREVVEQLGGGTATGRPVRAVQVGGPLGAYFPAHMLDIPLDYEAFA